MDIFYSSDVKSILHNKFVVIIGDSIQRGIYKDLVLLLHEDRYLREKEMRDKGEFSFHQDELIEGGRKGEMTNGVTYSEVRQYVTDVHLVRFYFVTRCYNAYVESILTDLKEGPLPDIVIMNSCLWDITRYGQVSIVDYKKNLVTLFDRFKKVLPNDCLMIWNTTLPISNKARGGFLIPEIEFRTTTLRLDVLEANYYARSVIVERGFDVLDLHFYLRHHLDKRIRDGIHWDMMAHRYISNLLLSHICKTFNIPKPKRGPAPFSSYPQQNQYMDSAIPAENNFSNQGFVSDPIQQRASKPNVDYPAVNNDKYNNVWQHSVDFYTGWNDMLNNALNTIQCLASPPGRHFQNGRHCNQGWQDSWNHNAKNCNENYGYDPLNSFGNRLCGRPLQQRWEMQQSRVQTMNNFTSPIFPKRQIPFFGPANNSNPYFHQDFFQPYQQNDHQGPSYAKRKNRAKPYKRSY